jgi:hypothetical protein
MDAAHDRDSQPRFFYLIPALSRNRFSYESRTAHLKRIFFGGNRQVPSGGVKIIYQHCDLLNKNGHIACPVHLGNFVVDWFEHTTPPISREQALAIIRPNDVLICPEVIPLAAEEFNCKKKIAFVQNWFLPELATGPDKSYEHFGFTGLLSCSQYITDYMNTRSRLECHLVTNGINTRLFTPEPGARIPGRVLCFNRRNIKDARKARRLLSADVRVQISCIELENKYSQTEIIDFYRHADIFMAIGYPEGFALPPLEAMACGCAVIGFTGGGAGEFMLDNETALVCPDGDSAALARSLERIVIDTALKERLRRAGATLARTYSLERMERELLAFAEKVAGTP